MGPREETPAAAKETQPITSSTARPTGKARNFRVWRGDRNGGQFVDYQVPIEPGMVVLDAIHRIQATQATDLAVRWNCKAGKCGSCSCEINGRPKLSVAWLLSYVRSATRTTNGSAACRRASRPRRRIRRRSIPGLSNAS